MNKFKNSTVLFVLLAFSSSLYAECGFYGSVTDRLNSCKEHGLKENGFRVITENKDGLYFYHEETDTIISPLFKKDEEQKCLAPYKKVTKLRNIFTRVPPLEKIEEGSFRCILPRASHYMLLMNETFL